MHFCILRSCFTNQARFPHGRQTLLCLLRYCYLKNMSVVLDIKHLIYLFVCEITADVYGKSLLTLIIVCHSNSLVYLSPESKGKYKKSFILPQKA